MDTFPAKRPRFIFAVCLALSVTGIFTFAAVPDLAAFDFWKNKLTDGSIASANADYTIDRFAKFTSKTRGDSTLLSRRFAYNIPFLGTLCACMGVSVLVIKTAQPNKAPGSQSMPLLNLRI
jgi:hypothetical protein